MKIMCETSDGGAVRFNEKTGAWASYGVTSPQLMYAGATLDDGRAVQFFFNRETGLVVVDVIDAKGMGGVEIVRQTIAPKRKA